MSEETAYQMTSILSGAVERGTAKKLRTLNVPLAGKTGTTNDNLMLGSSDFHLTLLLVFMLGMIILKPWVNMKQDQKQHYLFLSTLLRMLFLRKISKNSKFQKIFF